MAPRVRALNLKRGLCAALAVSALAALLAVAAAVAGKLPKAGDWDYEGNGGPQGNATLSAWLHVIPGKSSIYSLTTIIIGGTCKMKDGRIVRDHPVGASTAATLKVVIPVKADGSFSGTRNAVGDTGGKGTVRVKGVFNGVHVSGTVTAHMHDPVWGQCQGTGKFVRVKGTKVA